MAHRACTPQHTRVYPQALPLRSHHFQRVGKKPELTLVWEPEDQEQEPVKQVSTWGGPAFPEHHCGPAHPSAQPLGAPLPCLPHPSLLHPHPCPQALKLPMGFQLLPARPHSSPTLPPLGHSFLALPSLPWRPTEGRGEGPAYPSKAACSLLGSVPEQAQLTDGQTET